MVYRIYVGGLPPTGGDQRAIDLFGGFTRYQATGGYRAPPDIVEPVTVWEIITEDDITGFALWLKEQGNQDCVLVLASDGPVQWVGQCQTQKGAT